VLDPAGGSPYAHRTTYTTGGALKDVDYWWYPRPGIVNRWRVLHSTDAWDAWDFTLLPENHLTEPEQEAFLEYIIQAEPELIAITTDHEDRKEWTAFLPGGFDPKLRADHHRNSKGDPRYIAVGIRYRWHRKNGAAVFQEAWSSSGLPLLEKFPENARWSNRDRWDAAVVAHKEYERVSSEKRAHETVLRGLVHQIVGQEIQNQRAIAYAKFMEEFGQHSLWEGHLQANPLPEVKEPEGLYEAIKEAAENGRVTWAGYPVTDVWPDAPKPWSEYTWPQKEEPDDLKDDD
jgi:hypothetical protein